MKHLPLMLMSFLLTASVNVAVAKSGLDKAPVVMHSAFVDTPEVIDLSRAEPTSWPVPATSSMLPSGKGWPYFEENWVVELRRVGT